MGTRPDFRCLFAIASEQHGHFTTARARACGFKGSLLTHHTRSGRFVRVHRGVYRLRDYPSSPREEVVAAWLAVGKDKAVVSHASALELLELSDVISDAVHLTVPRSMRHLPSLPGVVIHTTTRPLRATNLTIREGIRVTSPTRTILDVAEASTGPEHVEMANRQAVALGLTTRQRLLDGARKRSQRVRRLVAGALDEAASRARSD
jgi:predicted transcriptional regulator of viral defense system